MNNCSAPKPQQSLIALAILCVLGAASLALTTMTNRWSGAVLQQVAPAYSWIASAAIPSFVVILCLYFAIGSKPLFALPKVDTDWRRIFRLSAIWLSLWLAASLAVVAATGRWTAYTHGALQIAAFLIFGLAGEEMLFRGIIFEQSRRACSGS